MKEQINQFGILALVLVVGFAGLFQLFVESPSGAQTYEYKTCCCTIVPLQEQAPIYDQAVHSQIQATGKSCEQICSNYYSKDGWTYSKEGYCPK